MEKKANGERANKVGMFCAPVNKLNDISSRKNLSADYVLEGIKSISNNDKGLGRD